MKRNWIPAFAGMTFLLAGCAPIMFSRGEVSFEDPFQKLDIQRTAALPQEFQGILLRLNVSIGGTFKSREESRIFASIKNNEGMKLDMVRHQTETFSPGSRPDSYVKRSETVFEGEGGKLADEVEMTTRGEIIRFISGQHKSKVGKFKIMSWSRTPVSPEGPVRPGDTWTYDEVMDVRLQSSFVKQKDPSPLTVHATSTLTGFAIVKGVRTAEIKTTATQFQEQRLKVLFKELKLDIHSQIEELAYVDYATGKIVARITTTNSQSNAPDAGIHDNGVSQSLFSAS